MKTITLHETWIGTHFPVALMYADVTGLQDGEERQLEDWYSGLVNEAEDRYTANPIIHFEYGEQSEFETCDITGLKGNCVAVTAFITDSEFRILGLNDDFGKPVIATTSCAMYPGNDVVREFINSKIKEKSCVAESAENLLS